MTRFMRDSCLTFKRANVQIKCQMSSLINNFMKNLDPKMYKNGFNYIKINVCQTQAMDQMNSLVS